MGSVKLQFDRFEELSDADLMALVGGTCTCTTGQVKNERDALLGVANSEENTATTAVVSATQGDQPIKKSTDTLLSCS